METVKFQRNVLPTMWLILTITNLLLAACNERPSSFVNDNKTQNRYFEETNQTVKGEFLRFFYKYGGHNSLGYPLTEEIMVDGWRVQYFEKGRLEYHPENEPAYRITVGWLGDLLNRRRPPISTVTVPRADNKNFRYFSQTGHTISGDFLQYFEVHGGSVRFGLPISEPFLLEGQLTQDFQSARFFWTPEAQDLVLLEDIGRVHLDQIMHQNKN